MVFVSFFLHVSCRLSRFSRFLQFSLTLESRHEVSHQLFLIFVFLGFVLVDCSFYFCQCNFCD